MLTRGEFARGVRNPHVDLVYRGRRVGYLRAHHTRRPRDGAGSVTKLASVTAQQRLLHLPQLLAPRS
jgi:hypothetical protein